MVLGVRDVAPRPLRVQVSGKNHLIVAPRQLLPTIRIFMPNYTYFAYLLRLWRERPDSPWRAMLENPQTGERQYFAGLEELNRFFQEDVTGVGSDVAEPSDDLADQEAAAPK